MATTVEGPNVSMEEREGVRVISIMYRHGSLAICMSLSEDEARKLTAELNAKVRR